MKNQSNPSRRIFVAGCICAGCAGLAGAAKPSSRNAKALGPAGNDGAEAPSIRIKDLKNYDIAFCGIYCGACEGRLKGIGDTGRKCKCCTNPAMESKCAIFTCAREKDIANCGLCPEFEGCEKLTKHHEKPLYRQAARTTCKKIKAEGLEVVNAELKKRWTCPACNKIFAWKTTENKCPKCEKPIQPLSEKDVG